MPVQVVCPKCKKPLSLGDDAAGQAGRCPACGASFRVSPSADSGVKRSTVGPAAPSSASVPAAPTGGGAAGQVPASLGPYEVRKELGRGAFGVVYQAHDPKLGRDVAIKVLNRDALASAKAVERFLREARVVAQMHHNNIVPVYQLGEQDGAHFIASKFIPGQVLSEAIPEKGMEPGRATELVIHLLEALQYAHDMDVLHRDVKPANAVLDARGQLYLMDFGLAGWVGQETGRMTQDGAVMGTPSYMAPEQAKGDIRHVGPAADQYSAGVTLYELLTEHLPFEGGPIQVLLYNVINTAPPRPSEWRADLDPRLEEICLKAIAKKPEDRYPSCRDFIDALKAWREVSGAPPLFEPVEDEEPPPRPEPKVKKTSSAGKGTVVKPPRSKQTLDAGAEERDEPAVPDRGRSLRPYLVVAGLVFVLAILAAAGGFALWVAPTLRGGGQGATTSGGRPGGIH